MPNNLFNDIQNNNIEGEYERFNRNPMQFLVEHKVDRPKECANDPKGAVQYLLNNGKMNQTGLNRLMQIATRMGFKF